ncbi:iron uptake system protein EfeO [Roseixanthobacter pseudopolyaromaticivorans]|uniref:iron uptake system protein EfeO n=1 Tax=Xanthobacteraceae TaxID=335928 RepID=UPI00372B6F18
MKRSVLMLATALSLTLGAAGAKAAISPLDLVAPIAQYKVYVTKELEAFVASTKEFTDAVKAGDLAKAKALYAAARAHYERIEPIAELFSDLDGAIDSRADDHAKKEKDPTFTGYHRIEYGLFVANSTDGLAPFADKLMADVNDLQARVKGLTFPPEKVVGGAAALLEEVAATKISGEEDRYSHTDLMDFQANIDGAQEVYTLFKPLLAKDPKNEAFLKKVDANFASVDAILVKYKTADGFESYDKLSKKDRKALAGPVNTLAEDLSKMRGLLGLK